MALVVLLRGVNVGGHRRFRPSKLAEQLRHFGVVNVGAAGTFVVSRSMTHRQLRAEIGRRLPFDAQIMICRGGQIVKLLSDDPFAGHAARTGLVRFISVLAARPRAVLATPMTIPARGRWLVKLLAVDGRFVFGVYRRQMQAIGHLGAIDRLFGVPATTRSWSTITAIGRALGHGGP